MATLTFIGTGLVILFFCLGTLILLLANANKRLQCQIKSLKTSLDPDSSLIPALRKQLNAPD
uniref:Uncharacterized protein n=1 Tax=Anguilla anguilla TaxID=7936 RepID=A0A0E9R324_ANGAN